MLYNATRHIVEIKNYQNKSGGIVNAKFYIIQYFNDTTHGGFSFEKREFVCKADLDGYQVILGFEVDCPTENDLTDIAKSLIKYSNEMYIEFDYSQISWAA